MSYPGDDGSTGRCRAYPRNNAHFFECTPFKYRTQSGCSQRVDFASRRHARRASTRDTHRPRELLNTIPPPCGTRYGQRLEWRGTRKSLPGLHVARSLLGVSVRGVRDGRRIPSSGWGHLPWPAVCGRARDELRRPAVRGPRQGFRGADQAADHRAAADHHRSGDVPRRPGRPRSVAGARHLYRRLPLRGRRQRAEHVHRPRHRRPDGPYVAATAGHRHRVARARASSSASRSPSSPRSGSDCSSTGCPRRSRSARSSSTSSSTR